MSSTTGTPRTAATRPSIKQAWLALPLIAGVFLTGCASKTPATTGRQTTSTPQISCPAGTHQRGGECLNNRAATPAAAKADSPPRDSLTCPPGTRPRAGECLNTAGIRRANNK